MEYKPFKMRSSPMKRNFGIGEKEEVSPGKEMETLSIKPIDASLEPTDKMEVKKSSKTFEEGKAESDAEKEQLEETAEQKRAAKRKKILSGIGDVLQSAIDAGAGTSIQKEKEAKREAGKTREQKLSDDELKHQREMDKIKALSVRSTIEDTGQKE